MLSRTFSRRRASRVYACALALLIALPAPSYAQGATVSGRLYHSVTRSSRLPGRPCSSKARGSKPSRAPTAPTRSPTSRPAPTTSSSSRAGFVPRPRRRHRRAGPGDARRRRRPRAALLRGRLGQPRRAQSVRVVSADVGAVGTGSREAAAGRLGAMLADPARRRRALVRSRALAAGDSRPRRRSRADPRRRPAHRRPVEPVRRSRRHGQPGGAPRRSRSCAARRRCSTARTPSAASSTSSPTTIPTKPRQRHARRRARSTSASAATEGGAARAISASATAGSRCTLGGSGRRSGDVDTPRRDGREHAVARGLRPRRRGVDRRAAASSARSYGYDDTKYGIPFVEEGSIQLTPRRHMIGSARRRRRARRARSRRFARSFGVRRYRHDELEGDEVGTAVQERHGRRSSVLAKHRAFGRLTGTFGGSVLDRGVQRDRRRKRCRRRSIRTAPRRFIYEELTWPHVTLQFGGRVEHARLRRPKAVCRTRTSPTSPARSACCSVRRPRMTS